MTLYEQFINNRYNYCDFSLSFLSILIESYQNNFTEDFLNVKLSLRTEKKLKTKKKRLAILQEAEARMYKIIMTLMPKRKEMVNNDGYVCFIPLSCSCIVHTALMFSIHMNKNNIHILCNNHPAINFCINI